MVQLYEALGDDEKALSTYRRAMRVANRNVHALGEVTTRIIEVYRRQQKLPILIQELEKKWPTAKTAQLRMGSLSTTI